MRIRRREFLFLPFHPSEVRQEGTPGDGSSACQEEFPKPLSSPPGSRAGEMARFVPQLPRGAVQT